MLLLFVELELTSFFPVKKGRSNEWAEAKHGIGNIRRNAKAKQNFEPRVQHKMQNLKSLS
jgi:hypothetical protein